MLSFVHREEGDGVHNSLAIVENIVELGPGMCWEAFYNIICPFYAFFIHREEGDGVHNSLANVENIVELGPCVCLDAFYSINCPFYAFLYTHAFRYTQRGGRRCAQQPGHCKEHC